ncbi:MAG: 5-(carboxyamino)imidazole ribonucleotide synthase [Deltaproteobacteria bacterium]|nr:5-(carboxyamino)imidazole ribonucleotide synthase [Deltaproteobacteria bacterium]
MSANKNIGILGSGQLARMLVEAGNKIGVSLKVLAENQNDPAAQVANQVELGSSKNPEVLKKFFSSLDLAIFENEFLDVNILREASKGSRVNFLPSLEAIALTQDKLLQKKLLNDLKIPTSKYFVVHSTDEIEKHFAQEAVLKWSRGGYDGKGTFFWKKENDSTPAEAFLKQSSSAIYAEEKIDFIRELAIQVSYSTSGEFISFPLVISEQKNGICHQMRGPANSLGVSSKLEDLAKSYAEKIAKAVPLIGTFAIEFFETKSGELLVNELAPRVHNSGHYSLLAANCSQFESHLRSVLGLKLPTITTSPYFGMLNLIGPAHLKSEKPAKIPDLNLKEFSNMHLYWYGKSELRAGRKMGHIHFSAKSLDEFNTALENLKKIEAKWIESL